MKINKTLFLFSALLAGTNCKDQNDANYILDVPQGTGIVVDGVKNDDEWEDANSIKIDNHTIYIKHNDNNLLFAFSKIGNDYLFPEILITSQVHDDATSWQTWHQWYHISYTNCFSQGTYGKYDNCLTEQPDWVAAPNITNGSPYFVEVSLPFAKLGVNTQVSSHFSIGFVMTDTRNIFKVWPPSMNIQNPQTWMQSTIH